MATAPTPVIPRPARSAARTKSSEEELVAAHLSPRGRPNEVHAVPAALWRRLGAFIIDTAIVLGIAALFLFVAAAVVGIKSPENSYAGLDRLIHFARAFESVLKPTVALAIILALVYSTVFAVIWGGRTVGRRLLRVQLVDGSGLPPTPVRAATRSALALLSFALFLGGFWLALFDRRGQTLHDKLTGTFVIRRK